MKRTALIAMPMLACATFAHGQNQYTICAGDSVRLNATGGNLYEWQPHGGLSNPYSATPWARPGATTQYTILQLQTSGNLIVNGDFNQGSSGFTSQYRDSTNVLREGYYSITSTTRDAHFAFRPCTDHTTGNGNMMVVNGASHANQKVWMQDIQVLPNTNYAFSAYINAGISDGDKCILQFSINGELLSAAFTIRNIRCEWQRFYAVWYSDTATHASIAIVNQNTERQGNDFGLDDILFEQFTTTSDSVRVVVNPRPETPVLQVNGATQFCRGTTQILSISAGADSLVWNNGSSSDSLFISSDSTLYATIVDSNGCRSLPSDTVVFHTAAEPATPHIMPIGGDSIECTTQARQYHWRINGHPIPNHDRKIKCTVFGAYTVFTNSDLGCESDESSPFVFQVTSTGSGTTHSNLTPGFTLVPNPARQSFRVFGRHDGEAYISITDAMGRMMEQGRLNIEEPIYTASWPAGLYLIKLTGAGTAATTLKLQVVR